MTGKVLLEHEAEFLPAALAIQEKPLSPTVRIVARTLIALLVVLFLWSVIGRLDIVVNAQGKIIPTGYSKTIAAIDTASVRALYVKEGQHVTAGDVLIELDSSASDAERDKATGDRTFALLQTARARALIEAIDSGLPPKLAKLVGVVEEDWNAARLQLDGQYRDYGAKLKRLTGDIARFEEVLPLASQRASDYQSLLKDRDVSYHAWLEKEQARMEIAAQLADAKNQRDSLVEETRRAAYEQLTEGSKLAAASQQDALRSDARSKLLKIVAPVDGTVQQLDAHTVGGVVAAAKPLMLIVPNQSQVEVEAFLENKDIGFVKEGQTVAVKIDTYDYTKYGTISGKVTHVSRDAIVDEKKGLIYSTRVALEKSAIEVQGKEMPLSPGMSVNVEIKTGDRRVIEYILSPLMRHQRESLNER
jgi:hemolysin D